MPGRKRFISRDDSSSRGGASSTSRDQHVSSTTGGASNKAATLPASTSPGMMTGISDHGIAHHKATPDNRGSRSRSQHSGPRSQLPQGSASGSRMGRSFTVESPNTAAYGSPRQSDIRSRMMRHDSASSSTSDVSANLASLRTDQPFNRDTNTKTADLQSQLTSTKLSPSWTSGHMTYPGRRSGSNESDRTSDVSQKVATSNKTASKFSAPRSKFLADSGASPVIAHHIASPPESRRPIASGGARGPVVTSPPSKARTLSSETSGFGSMARQKMWQKSTSKDRSSLDSTTSEPATPKQQQPAEESSEPAVEHGPARAKPFLGRANTIQLPASGPELRSKSQRRIEKSPTIPENSVLKETKLEGQKVLKDIDNTIKDMTKALKRDIHGLTSKKGSSFDSQITPIALHTTDKSNLAKSGSTKEERIFKYKQARRKELAKIANQGKSKSMELPETERERYLSEIESHTPKFSRKYGSRESLGSKESLEDKKPMEKKPATFTSIAVPTQQIVMPSPVLPKSVTSPPIATVSPIMVNTSAVLSTLSSGVGNGDALTTVVPSHLHSRMSTNVDRTRTSPAVGEEVSLSAFKPVKASSPTKIIPTSAPLDQLSSQSRKSPIKVPTTLRISPVRVKPEKSRRITQAHSVPVLSSAISPPQVFASVSEFSSSTSIPASISTTTTTTVRTTASSLVSLRSPPTTAATTTQAQNTSSSSSVAAMSVLPKSSLPTTSSTLASSPVSMVTSTLTTSMATTVTTTTASLPSPLTSIRSASSSDVSSVVPKRHVLKKQKNVEESDTVSCLKQFVMTPAAIARAERKLSKSKSETSMAMIRDHDPKQSANAIAEKTFLEKSRRTSKDIEKWEDLIMNVADMQQELENIEFKIKQANNNTQGEKTGERRCSQKSRHGDKNEKNKEAVSRPKEHRTIKEEIITEEIKIRAKASPERRRDKVSPEKMKGNNTKKPSTLFDIEQLLKQEAGELLQYRKKLLQREDSFNRPDSPIRDPMPLPKESVIKRNRLRECVSSSSSEGGPSPQRSPRVSPRVHRRQKKQQVAAATAAASKHASAPSNMLTVEHAHKQLYQKEVGGRRDPNRINRWRNVQGMLRRGGILPDSARVVLLQGRHYLQQDNRTAHARRTRQSQPSTVHPSEVTEGPVKVKVTSAEGHENINHKMETTSQKGKNKRKRSNPRRDINRSKALDDK